MPPEVTPATDEAGTGASGTDAPTATPRLRRAARILLTDDAGRLLLFRFTPEDSAPFWVTPGGEAEPHEDFPEAAIRELREETGINAHPGPEIARRGGQYTIFTGETIRADERFFHVRSPHAEIDTSGHTALEQAVMQAYHWFTRHDLANWAETIYPLDIIVLLDELNTLSTR